MMHWVLAIAGALALARADYNPAPATPLFDSINAQPREVQPGWLSTPRSCAWQPTPDNPLKSVVRSPLPHTYLSAADLPASFDWRDVNGTGYDLTTRVYTQFQPYPCGSCWSFATTGAMSDRLKIQQFRATNKTPSDIQIAPQALLDCGMLPAEGGGLVAGSCYGGSSLLAHAYIHQFGIVDETCAPYRGASPSHWAEVDCHLTMCKTCDAMGNCTLDPTAPRYFVDEYGVLKLSSFNGSLPQMVQAMMAEIYTRGPIVCDMYAHSPVFEDYKGGIMRDPTKWPGTTHDLVLLGWGVENGTPYWIGRNSFGTHWGEAGWFRAERGVNIFNMEGTCYWGTVVPPKTVRV